MTVAIGLEDLASAGAALGNEVLRVGGRIVTAESCTAGLIAMALTESSGASGWFDFGVAAYSNAAKRDFFGVAQSTLATHGAVSEAVAAEMAEGALNRAGPEVCLALSVTGIAGPTGGTPEKPVGTVCFGWALRLPVIDGDREQTIEVATRYLAGDRSAIRFAAALIAIEQGRRRLLRWLIGRPPVA